jgi:hypothetical protein
MSILFSQQKFQSCLKIISIFSCKSKVGLGSKKIIFLRIIDNKDSTSKIKCWLEMIYAYRNDNSGITIATQEIQVSKNVLIYSLLTHSLLLLSNYMPYYTSFSWKHGDKTIHRIMELQQAFTVLYS